MLQAYVQLTFQTFLGILNLPMGKGTVRRVTSLFDQMVNVGVASLPTVALANFLLGVILALQGASQLTKLGAIDLVGSLVSFSILREIGPLITAVIVIGRSGSAITAELGTMKVSEEIEALNVMAINPVRFLVVPRVLAMMIMLPALTVLGEGIGLFAGWLISVTSLFLDPFTYVHYSITAVEQSDLFTGLLKALVFGTIIGTICCYYGMGVEGGAEGVGRSTTKAVVTCLTSMLVADAILTAIINFA